MGALQGCDRDGNISGAALHRAVGEAISLSIFVAGHQQLTFKSLASCNVTPTPPPPKTPPRDNAHFRALSHRTVPLGTISAFFDPDVQFPPPPTHTHTLSPPLPSPLSICSRATAGLHDNNDLLHSTVQPDNNRRRQRMIRYIPTFSPALRKKRACRLAPVASGL